MKNRKKRSHSLLFYVFISFFTVVLVGMTVWTVMAAMMSRANVINQTKTASDEVYKLVRELYRSNESIHDLANGGNVDEESFQNIRRKLQLICDSFDLQYLYLFNPDPKDEHYSLIYVVVATDETEDDLISDIKRGYIVEVPNGIGKNKRQALNGEFPDDPDFVTNDYGRVYSWYYPLTDKNGKLDMLIGMDYQEDEVEARFIRIILYLLIPIAVQLLLILICMILFVKRIIMKPLSFVSSSMRSFVEDQTQDLPSLTDTLNPKGEIRDITNAYDKMRSDITDYLSNIHELTQKEIKQAELDKLTQHIQKGILPSETSLDGDGFSAFALAESAKNVGGDFYDCFVRDDGSVCAVIGDVSGKGITAALFMAMTKTMIREHLKVGEAPADVLNYVNDEICNTNPTNMFATVFAVVYDPATSTITYANAGHTLPVLFGGSEPAKFLDAECGIAVGLFPDAGITESTITTDRFPGIFLYTDGITEAVNRDGKFFGESRLLEAFSEKVSAEKSSAQDVAKDILRVITEYEDGSEQYDDITMLAFLTK